MSPRQFGCFAKGLDEVVSRLREAGLTITRGEQ